MKFLLIATLFISSMAISQASELFSFKVYNYNDTYKGGLYFDAYTSKGKNPEKQDIDCEYSSDFSKVIYTSSDGIVSRELKFKDSNYVTAKEMCKLVKQCMLTLGKEKTEYFLEITANKKTKEIVHIDFSSKCDSEDFWAYFEELEEEMECSGESV